MRRALSLAALALALGVSSAQAQTPVELHGALAVSGNKIVGKHGQPVQLSGMSFYWPNWGGEAFFTKGATDWLVTDWKCNLIRVPVGVEPAGGYLSNPGGMTARVKTVVDAAIAKGVYVIIDWHDHNAPAHTEQAKTFFREMSTAYGKVPNVIFEIFNEPDKDDTWAGVKTYANAVIPVIRANSTNLIVVGTTNWSQDVDSAADDPVTGFSNIAYTLHFYAGTHGAWLRTKADYAISAGIALFITEWGTSAADGGSTDKTVYTAASQAWLDWAVKRKLSWANWSLVDKTESSAALRPGASRDGGWNAGNLSESGTWVRNAIIALNTAPPPVDTIVVPGRLEAEKLSTMSGVQSATTNDAGGGSHLTGIESGDWAEYTLKVGSAGAYKIMARVASAAAGSKINVKLDGAQVATINIPATGGLTTWAAAEYVNLSSNLTAGTHKLRLEFVGTGTASLFNLNWLNIQTGVVGLADRVVRGALEVRALPGHVAVSLPAGHDWTRIDVVDAKGRQIVSQSVLAGEALDARLPAGGNGLRFVRLHGASEIRTLSVAAVQ